MQQVRDNSGIHTASLTTEGFANPGLGRQDWMSDQTVTPRLAKHCQQKEE